MILEVDKIFIYLVQVIVFAFLVCNFWKLKVQFKTNLIYIIITTIQNIVHELKYM